jgi:uncharacterized protein YbjT (DUF2867 family)
MHIAIAGAHGKIARQLAVRLVGAGHEVRGLIRNPDQRNDIRADGGEPVVCDLESASVDEVALAIGAEVDAVVFAAGAGPGSGPARKESMDHDGAVKLLDAATARGAAHYVMVSAFGADADHEGDEVFDVYLRAKGRADDAVRAGPLPFTILAPTRLTDEDPTGAVALGADPDGGPVSRADVAAVLAELIERRAGLGSTLRLTTGDVLVADAVAALG